MRIVLINPGINAYNEAPPLNLGILAAVLEKENHEVIIIDKLSGDSLATIDNFQPDFAGITGTSQVIEDAYACAEYCRKRDIWTIIGGVHASILPQEALQHADTVVVGEGELTLPELIKKRKKGIVMGKPVKNLDDLPSPAYHLMNMEFYLKLSSSDRISFLSFAKPRTTIGCLLTSRGCPHSCIFCYNSYRTTKVRFNSAERTIDEIKLLMENGAESIFFIEDNFFINKDRLLKIFDLIKKENLDIKWAANSRVDNINEEILKSAKLSGCQQVTFGWESGSQRILDILNKKITVEQNMKSIQMCNKAGIDASGTVMIGNPTETKEDLMQTYNFIAENDIRGPVGVCITTPYPGTKLWEWCKNNNKLSSNFSWSQLDFHHIIPMSEVSDSDLTLFFNKLSSLAIRRFVEIRKRRHGYG